MIEYNILKAELDNLVSRGEDMQIRLILSSLVPGELNSAYFGLQSIIYVLKFSYDSLPESIRTLSNQLDANLSRDIKLILRKIDRDPHIKYEDLYEEYRVYSAVECSELASMIYRYEWGKS